MKNWQFFFLPIESDVRVVSSNGWERVNQFFAKKKRKKRHGTMIVKLFVTNFRRRFSLSEAVVDDGDDGDGLSLS